jgi:hypothetical protein
MDERLRTPWSAWDAVPVAIVAILATVLIGTILALTLPRGIAFALVQLTFEVTLAFATLGWLHLRHRGSIAALRVRSDRARADVGFGLMAGVGLFAVTVFAVAPLLFGLLALITGDPVIPPDQEVLPPDPGTVDVSLVGVAVVLAAPVAEELFFRGLLFGGLRRRFGFRAAALISAAVFAAFHVLPLLMPLLFVVGLGLAWVYERRGSLLPAMAAHAAFNVIGYALILRAA